MSGSNGGGGFVVRALGISGRGGMGVFRSVLFGGDCPGDDLASARGNGDGAGGNDDTLSTRSPDADLNAPIPPVIEDIRCRATRPRSAFTANSHSGLPPDMQHTSSIVTGSFICAPRPRTSPLMNGQMRQVL